MSWITDEANQNSERENKEAYHKAVLAQSNYWARLLRQIEADVATINEHDYWKKKLGGMPLRFGENYDGNGYNVSKSIYPAVAVLFANRGDHIEVQRRYIEGATQEFKVATKELASKEQLKIATQGDLVVLLAGRNEQVLVVPEEASQYILKFIMEALKATG